MNALSPSPATPAVGTISQVPATVSMAAAIFAAAELLLTDLSRGHRITSDILRRAMQTATGGSDAAGIWSWRDAYDACEIAQILFLRKFGPAMRRRGTTPAAFLGMLARVTSLFPTQTRRSEESQALQQFSTPIDLGFVAATAAGMTGADAVLEPSAGTGCLAIFAELEGVSLALNEFADTRADLLDRLFPDIGVGRHDAAQIDDRLTGDLRPTVVLMNPPFSVAAHVEGRMRDAAFRHVASAFARLADGGRLVAITGANLAPDAPAWREGFIRLQGRGRVVFSAPIDGRVYARHGTTIETRLTVIDKIPADDAHVFPAAPGLAPDATTLLNWVTEHVPARRPIVTPQAVPAATAVVRATRQVETSKGRKQPSFRTPAAKQLSIELAYEPVDWAPSDRGMLTDAIYEGYALQSIRIPEAKPHPTLLVQSAAMASVAPPKPSYRPRLPATIVTDGLLSDAQLESVILLISTRN